MDSADRGREDQGSEDDSMPALVTPSPPSSALFTSLQRSIGILDLPSLATSSADTSTSAPDNSSIRPQLGGNGNGPWSYVASGSFTEIRDAAQIEFFRRGPRYESSIQTYASILHRMQVLFSASVVLDGEEILDVHADGELSREALRDLNRIIRMEMREIRNQEFMRLYREEFYSQQARTRAQRRPEAGTVQTESTRRRSRISMLTLQGPRSRVSSTTNPGSDVGRQRLAPGSSTEQILADLDLMEAQLFDEQRQVSDLFERSQELFREILDEPRSQAAGHTAVPPSWVQIASEARDTNESPTETSSSSEARLPAQNRRREQQLSNEQRRTRQASDLLDRSREILEELRPQAAGTTGISSNWAQIAEAGDTIERLAATIASQDAQLQRERLRRQVNLFERSHEIGTQAVPRSQAPRTAAVLPISTFPTLSEIRDMSNERLAAVLSSAETRRDLLSGSITERQQRRDRNVESLFRWTQGNILGPIGSLASSAPVPEGSGSEISNVAVIAAPPTYPTLSSSEVVRTAEQAWERMIAEDRPFGSTQDLILDRLFTRSLPVPDDSQVPRTVQQLAALRSSLLSVIDGYNPGPANANIRLQLNAIAQILSDQIRATNITTRNDDAPITAGDAQEALTLLQSLAARPVTGPGTRVVRLSRTEGHRQERNNQNRDIKIVKRKDIRNMTDVEIQQEILQIRQDIEATSTSKVAPPMSETELIQSLVFQFLTHEGYSETAKALANEVNEEKRALSLDPNAAVHGFDVREDEDAGHRQSK